MPSSLALAIREEDAVVEEYQSRASRALLPARRVGSPLSGAIDLPFGDGRVPAEMNWGNHDLPERAQDKSLAFVVRRWFRKNAEQPRLDFSVAKRLGADLGHPPGSLHAT